MHAGADQNNVADVNDIDNPVKISQIETIVEEKVPSLKAICDEIELFALKRCPAPARDVIAINCFPVSTHS